MDQRPEKSMNTMHQRARKALYCMDQRPEIPFTQCNRVARKHLWGRRSAVEVVYGYFQCWETASPPARNFSPLGREKKKIQCLPFNFRILTSVAERRKECAIHKINNMYNGKQMSSLIIIIKQYFGSCAVLFSKPIFIKMIASSQFVLFSFKTQLSLLKTFSKKIGQEKYHFLNSSN